MNGKKKAKKPTGGRTAKGEWVEFQGMRVYFRSGWEANYARYLHWRLGRGELSSWEHEAEEFRFPGVTRGCVSYLPDFRVSRSDGSVEYHEVKGHMDAKSKTKLRRMAKHFPRIKVVLVDAKAYRQLAAAVRFIVPGWR